MNSCFASGVTCSQKSAAVPHRVSRKQRLVTKAQFSAKRMAPYGRTSKRQGVFTSAVNTDGTEIASGVPDDANYPVVYTAVTVASLLAFSFGYHLGVLNGPLQQIASDLGFAANTSLQGLVVSISLAGAAVGSLAGSGLADALGRKKAFLLDALPLLIGSTLCAISTDSTTMLAGRALVGLGIGFASALVPLYISEIAPTKIRGTLGSVNQLMICIGILAALVVNVAIPASSWRIMFWIATAPPALLILGMLFASPESPAYLLAAGKRAEAEKAASTLWGSSYRSQLYGDEVAPALDETIGTMEVGEMVTDTAKGGEETGDVSWGEMMSGSNGRLIGIACILFVIQQFSGINAIVYFSSSVFRDAGLQGEALASAAVGVINVVGTTIAASLMDKKGRKQLLTLSLAGQGLAMLSMAAAFTIPALKFAAGPVALVGTLAYVLMFALGTGPVPGLLCAEILPTAIRGRGISLALGVHWICNFMLGQLFLTAVSQVGVSAVYCFFAAVCAMGVAFVSTSIVETKGKTPEEIGKLMQL